MLTGRQVGGICGMVWLCAFGGCASEADSAGPSLLQITHHLGGTHRRALLHAGVWYQTFGRSLLIIDPTSADLIREIRLGEIGRDGPATDVARIGTRLYVLLEDDQVVDLSIKDPREPHIIGRRSRDTLGLSPRALSVVGQTLYVSGESGARRWDDGTTMLAGLGAVGRVTDAGVDLVAPIGRRVHRLRDGQYLGSANMLQPLPVHWLGREALLFVRQEAAAARVGIMTTQIRELDPQRLTIVVPGTVRAARPIGQHIWIATETTLRACSLIDDAGQRRLVTRMQQEIPGILEIAEIDEGSLALAGTFGRAIFHLPGPQVSSGGVLRAVHREPGGLRRAESDGRFVLAGGPSGTWTYRIGLEAMPTEDPLDPSIAPRQSAATACLAARIGDEGRRVEIVGSGVDMAYAEPDGAIIHCIAAVDGDLWIGHERGVTVLRPTGAGLERVGVAPFLGPVRFIAPLLLGGGAAWVSEREGFGVARLAATDRLARVWE